MGEDHLIGSALLNIRRYRDIQVDIQVIATFAAGKKRCMNLIL